ncbi:fimbrial protein [Enterobacter sp. V87_3]|uniref:fimbrial protein n=1 Tax=Enterobacter sp. V87_3 TaxID=3044236 RepID=UPI00249F79F4|nr:fimbrial protein [Enterobacter sp. V87_3]MDI3425133.1 fimbrial protein [Enterobacter sp. V87_3]
MKNKIVYSFFAASILVVSSLPALASDSGTVNFAGKIVADTCVVNVDDSNSTVSTVTFADTYPSDYGSDGKVGTSKNFKISVSGCDPLVSKLNLKFSGTTTDAAYKRLQNDLTGAGNATHVGITVTNNNGGKSDVLFNGSVPDGTTDVTNDPEGTAASVFNYTANVIQVGDTVPTAGHYSASATFEVMYR